MPQGCSARVVHQPQRTHILPQRSQCSWKHTPRDETVKYEPPKCQILDVIFQRNPKDSPKRMLTATDPCWMLAKERAQGGVWTSRDKQLVPQHSGNERHSTAKSSRHIPNILAAGGQLRGESLHGPEKAESAHLPGHPLKQISMQPGVSLHNAQQQLSHNPPHSPPPPEPAGCPGFNPTGSIMPIISSIFNLLPSIFNPLIWGESTNPFILRVKQSTASSHPISISLIPGNRNEVWSTWAAPEQSVQALLDRNMGAGATLMNATQLLKAPGAVPSHS